MSRELRVVYDTNVVVSALLFGQSIPAQALFAVHGRGTVLLSEPTLIELSEVLSRPKFDRYLTQEERERFLAALLHEATLIEISDEVRVCRDPKDDKFLDLALNGTATHLVTGDEDLLVLDPFRGIPIVTPARFLELLSQESQPSDGGPPATLPG